MPIRYHYTMSKLKFIRKNQNLYSDSTLYRAKKSIMSEIFLTIFNLKSDIINLGK